MDTGPLMQPVGGLKSPRTSAQLKRAGRQASLRGNRLVELVKRRVGGQSDGDPPALRQADDGRHLVRDAANEQLGRWW